MTAQPNEPVSPGQLGFDDARTMVSALYVRGVSLDEIGKDMGDRAAAALSEAIDSEGIQYAQAYDDAARELVDDLRSEEAAEMAGKPEPGSPHPDRPGWVACPRGCGVYRHERSLAREAERGDREAC